MTYKAKLKALYLIAHLIIFIFMTGLASGKNGKLKSELPNWKEYRKKVEMAVKNRDLTRTEAENRYDWYIMQAAGRSEPYEDPILEENFKKAGVKNLRRLKLELLDNSMPPNRLDEILGGLFRHIQTSKDNKLNMHPRLKAYFKNRIGLNKKQIKYLISISKNIGEGKTNGRF